jgi:HEPN domain-containing protein
MSAVKGMNRAKDWLPQSEHTLNVAKWCLKGKYYDSVCFLSQQAAEMCVKALCQFRRLECWEHSIKSILDELNAVVDVPETIINLAKKLDKYYIPTRYPNSFEKGAPKDYYTKDEAEDAIEYGEEIIRFCKRHIQE